MNSQLGTGSVWNPRTWHWETRSYNAWAEAHLRRKLLAVSATGDGVPLAVRVRRACCAADGTRMVWVALVRGDEPQSVP